MKETNYNFIIIIEIILTIICLSCTIWITVTQHSIQKQVDEVTRFEEKVKEIINDSNVTN